MSGEHRKAEHGDETPLSREQEAFVRNIASVYVAPPLSATQRARFDARLEERITTSHARRRAWAVAFASIAALLAIVVVRARLEPRETEVATERRAASQSRPATSGDAWLLAMATESSSESDDALPADYVAISDLLIGN